MEELDGRLDQYRMAETLADMQSGTVMAIAILAIGLAVYPLTWKVIGYPVTLVHELGHAVAALVVGYRLHGITVKGDMSGATAVSGIGPLRMLWTFWWGYPAPAVLGAGLLWSAASGWSHVALGFLVAGMLLIFVYSRSALTFLVVLLTGAVLGLIGWYGADLARNAIVFGFAWLLLVGSVRAFYSVTRLHFTRDGVEASDAYLMGRQARIIPGPIWLLTFAAAIGASTWFGVRFVLDAITV